MGANAVLSSRLICGGTVLSDSAFSYIFIILVDYRIAASVSSELLPPPPQGVKYYTHAHSLQIFNRSPAFPGLLIRFGVVSVHRYASTSPSLPGKSLFAIGIFRIEVTEALNNFLPASTSRKAAKYAFVMILNPMKKQRQMSSI